MKILATGSALPEQTVTNEMMSRVVETDDEWIRSRTGISTRHISNGDTTLTLALAASRLAITRAGISHGDIGLVVCASVTGEYLTPSLACMLQRDLKLPESVLAFDINAACSGFIYALGVAQRLLEPGKYALIIGSEVLSRVTDYTDRSTCVLFGDGAGAVIAEPCDNKFLFVPGTRGNTEVLRIGSVTSSENPFASPVTPPKPVIYMDGREVYKFAVDAVLKSVQEVLSKAGADISEIDYFVCHQANLRIINTAASRLGMPLDKFFINIDKRGNTSAASVPIALDELNATGNLKRGDKLILAGFGGGLTYGAIYLEW